MLHASKSAIDQLLDRVPVFCIDNGELDVQLITTVPFKYSKHLAINIITLDCWHIEVESVSNKETGCYFNVNKCKHAAGADI